MFNVVGFVRVGYVFISDYNVEFLINFLRFEKNILLDFYSFFLLFCLFRFYIKYRWDICIINSVLNRKGILYI